MTNYFQCTLRKQTGLGHTEKTSWIPEQFAVLNEYISLKDRKTKQWTSGWKVINVGPYKLSEDQLPDPHEEIKAHKKRTGDSASRGEPLLDKQNFTIS